METQYKLDGDDRKRVELDIDVLIESRVKDTDLGKTSSKEYHPNTSKTKDSSSVEGATALGSVKVKDSKYNKKLSYGSSSEED